MRQFNQVFENSILKGCLLVKAIQCNQLTKNFGDKTVLTGVDLEIHTGSIVGLLGKNGAGKTTLNRILTGLSFATSGDVCIFENGAKCGNRKISFLSENISVFPNLSAYENLCQVFLINGLTPDAKRINNILDVISIENSKKRAGKFSLGMTRRLQIAMAVLVVEQDIIILDEPTNGLDINGVLWLKELLESLKRNGKTLIITSHAIRELENTLSHYSIMSGGKIVSFGRMSDLQEANTVISLYDADVDKVSSILSDNGIVNSISPGAVTISHSNADISQKCMALFLENRIVPLNFSSQKKSLVDLFFSYTGDYHA